MMDLDEAIQHCEEVAEEQEKLYRLCPASESDMFYCDGTGDCKALKNGKNRGCQKCAEEHRQLAEWLKELKAYKEQDSDAISRQAVLEGLASIAKAKAKSDAQKLLMGRVMFFTEQLPSVTPQQRTGRWIPVSERLPEERGDYLVTQKATFTDYVYISVTSYAHNLYDVDEYDFADKKRPGWYEYDSEWGYREFDNVIAWMPLPEPYKAESEK